MRHCAHASAVVLLTRPLATGRVETAMAIDLLVFGPHPDDLEIGLGGTIARHVAEGHTVGLCDLTEGEMSSNGTVAERRAEAAAAARVLGAAWRENLHWPDGDIAATPNAIRSAVDMIRCHRPRAIAIPYWDDRHPDHVAASQVLRLAAFKSRLRGYATDADPWSPGYTPDPAVQSTARAMVGSMSISEKADQMRGTNPGGGSNFEDIFRTPDNAN